MNKRDKEIPFSMHYLNCLLTANKRGEQTFNTLILGRIQYEYCRNLTCGWGEVLGKYKTEFEKMLERFNLKLKISKEEDMVGFCNE